MKIRSITSLAPAALLVLLACGGEPAAEEDRDLTLPPAEAVTAINDAPDGENPAAGGTTPPATTRTPPPPPTPRNQVRATPPAPPAPDLVAGTGFLAFAADTLTSRHNSEGDTVMAMVGEDILNARGRTVIPIGAILYGTMTSVAPAESPGGEGTMMITFHQVSFDGRDYAIELATDSIGTRMKGRGVTAGDAAKVGAGAVVGAIAGRVIGGNRTGTAVGAAAGAAAGVGIAAATRDVDIILDAGSAIFLTVAADFKLQPIG